LATDLQRAEWRARYYRKNRERILAQNKVYVEANKEHRAMVRHARYERNKESITAANKAWAKANPEKRAATYRRYRQKHADKVRADRRAYTQLHKKEIGERIVRYRKTEAGRLVAVAASQRRRARKRAAGSVSTADVCRILAADRCHICGKRFTAKRLATLDHVIPLSRGGEHHVTNLAAAHGSCNHRKHARLEDDDGQRILL
jgi:5-methylcytosine-specific restriction endonuclease McrA